MRKVGSIRLAGFLYIGGEEGGRGMAKAKGMKQHAAKIPAPFKHYLTEAGERVVQLYDEWGKPEEAAKWRAELARKPPAENNVAKP